MLSVIGFLVVLAPLVVIHEFGHFLFARLFNVRADAFSVGFGPVLFEKQIGETSWRLSLIPLGGYVKLLGEDPTEKLPPELVNRSLGSQAKWKRFFIFAGGPLFNFAWAAIVYGILFIIGEEQLTTRIGRVLPESTAEKAGLKSGDVILTAQGKPVKWYTELAQILDSNINSEIAIEVRRKKENSSTETLSLKVPTQQAPGFSVYGEEKHIGTIDGISEFPRGLALAITEPGSPGARAEIKTGDQAESFNGVKLEDYEHLETLYQNLAPGSAFSLALNTGKTVNFTKPARSENSLGTDLGLHSTELLIESVVGGSPAETSGIKSGDRIYAVDGVVLKSFFQLRALIQKAGEENRNALVQVIRNGDLKTFSILPKGNSEKDALLRSVTSFTIGVAPMRNFAMSNFAIERTLNPISLVYKAIERMIVMSARNFISIKKMFTGDVSMKQLGGPILIGKIAGESLNRGWRAFLATMAILSIGLGVLNILPVPVLDGGHILLLGIEAIRRKPLTLKQIELAHKTGFALIALLMVIVFKNDISRSFLN